MCFSKHCNGPGANIPLNPAPIDDIFTCLFVTRTRLFIFYIGVTTPLRYTFTASFHSLHTLFMLGLYSWQTILCNFIITGGILRRALLLLVVFDNEFNTQSSRSFLHDTNQNSAPVSSVCALVCLFVFCCCCYCFNKQYYPDGGRCIPRVKVTFLSWRCCINCQCQYMDTCIEIQSVRRTCVYGALI